MPDPQPLKFPKRFFRIHKTSMANLINSMGVDVVKHSHVLTIVCKVPTMLSQSPSNSQWAVSFIVRELHGKVFIFPHSPADIDAAEAWEREHAKYSDRELGVASTFYIVQHDIRNGIKLYLRTEIDSGGGRMFWMAPTYRSRADTFSEKDGVRFIQDTIQRHFAAPYYQYDIEEVR